MNSIFATTIDDMGRGKTCPTEETCPVSDLPMIDDAEPTMSLLALSDDEEDTGYDPYDTGSFRARKS